jgi:hypothetical protein
VSLRRAALASWSLWAAACAGAEGTGGDESPPPEGCPSLGRADALGVVSTPELTEASGLARGGGADPVWWTHNDSGDEARLFALDDRGRLAGTATLASVRPVDIEDIGRRVLDDGTVELVVADIGDNGTSRDAVVLYSFAEPALDVDAVTVAPSALVLTYDDGEAHDAEALAVDPVDGATYIFTKVPTGITEVYRVPADARLSAVLERVATLDFTAPPLDDHDRLVTSADISPDGRWIALRTYTTAWIWRRPDGVSIADALASAPCPADVEPERQGEALGWGEGGFATLSEGSDETLYFYRWDDATARSAR